MMNEEYREELRKYTTSNGMKTIKDMVLVSIPSDKIKKVHAFTKKVIPAKNKESQYILDGNNQQKRFCTGVTGEVAIETLLEVDFVDWRVGNSRKFAKADLKSIGLNVGVKCVEHGNFPVVFKHSKEPEIITIKMNRDTVLVLGVATAKVLNKYQDDKHILSPALRAKNTKSGFYGFDKLIPFSNLDELTNIIKKLK